jgi:hypothetical protein
MRILGILAADYHQRPSTILIPQAPGWLRWWLDEALLYLETRRRQVEQATPSRSTPRASLPDGVTPVGTVVGQTIEWAQPGRAIPWVERGPDGQWRQVPREG